MTARQGRCARTSRTSWSVCVAGSTSRGGRAEPSASVDALEARGLVGGAVGPGPGALGGAGAAAVDVAPEDDRAGGRSTLEQRGELGALRVVRGRPRGRACDEVGGAHVDADSGADAQPPAPLAPGLRLEVVAVGALDRRLGEHRVTEGAAAARSDAGEGLARDGHRREAQVVARPPGDPSDVTAAGLVERHRVRVRGADPRRRHLHAGRVGHLAVAAGEPGQAQVHLHQRVRRRRASYAFVRRDARARGSAGARHGQDERASQRQADRDLSPAHPFLERTGRPVGSLHMQVVTCLYSSGIERCLPRAGGAREAGDPRRAPRSRRPDAVRALHQAHDEARARDVATGDLAAPAGVGGGRPRELPARRQIQVPLPRHHAAPGHRAALVDRRPQRRRKQ